MTASELSEVTRQVTQLVATAVRDGQVDSQKAIEAMEARLRAMPRGSDGAAAPTLGKSFIESKEFHAFMDARQPGACKWEVETKDFTRDTVSIPSQHIGLVNFVSAVGRMRSILPVMPVTSNAVEYGRAITKTVTGSITQVNEGDVKAKASWTYQTETANIITSAETAGASRQALEDSPALAGAIDGELTSQVLLNEEDEILNGVGTKGHMDGFMHLAPTFAGGITGDTPLDLIARAIAQLEGAGFSVSATVLNSADWLAISLMKDLQTHYLISNPGQGATPAYLWNRPAIVSPKMPAGKFLVGAFSTFSYLLDRSRGVVVDTTGSNGTDFEKNMITIRAESRSGLAITRPEGFLQGTLTAPLAASTSKR